MSLELPEKISSEQADTVVCAPCGESTSQKNISKAVVELLEKIGDPVYQLTEKGCCGAALYDFGFWDTLKTAGKK